jgi:hypothetical protein
MKPIRALVAFVVALGLSAGVSYAKKPDTTPKPPKPPAPLVGIVLKVDGPKLVIQTRGKGAGEVNVVTDANTKFEAKGKAAALTDIKPGQEVVITPPTGLAQKVVVADEPGKKKKKKADK